jgi:hypothetical protein
MLTRTFAGPAGGLAAAAGSAENRDAKAAATVSDRRIWFVMADL